MTCEVKYCLDLEGRLHVATWRMDRDDVGLTIFAALPGGASFTVTRPAKDLDGTPWPAGWAARYLHDGRISPPLRPLERGGRYRPQWALPDRGLVEVADDAWRNQVGEWFNVGRTANP